MHLPRCPFLAFPLLAFVMASCSILSNNVDDIKQQCSTDVVDNNMSYVKILDSHGKILKSPEFALRWLDDAGPDVRIKGNCIELDRQESRSLIIRSRLGTEGVIFATDAKGSDNLSSIRLVSYKYGSLRKSCDQTINTNQLSLGLPVSFEDSSASGYTIKAAAVVDNQQKMAWEFINSDSAAPNLDLAALANGHYDLKFELSPLFSEAGVAQYFNCELIIDRKTPQISLLSKDGGLLTAPSIELRPSSRMVWQSNGKTATELVEYCFAAAGTATSGCSDPSISNDPIVVPESGSWKFIYRGVDAARNQSDWAALDIDVIDEVKLADILNKLELARFYQKSGQTQAVALQLLGALEAYQSLITDKERKRVKKDLDFAIFQHQRDAQDTFVGQWNDKESVEYLGSLRSPDSTAHAFLREIVSYTTFGLSFLSKGSALFPEINLTSRNMVATCSIQGLTAYMRDGVLQIFDGKNVTTLPGDSQRLSGLKNLKFSEDCRFVVMTDQIGMLFLIDRFTLKTVDFPEFEYDMECRFSFALGEGDASRYYSYCSRINRNSFQIYAFSPTAKLESPKIPALAPLPLQLIAKDNYIFVLAKDKSMAVLDANFNIPYSTMAGRTGELVYDEAHQQVLARYDGFQLYDIYGFVREGNGPATVKKLPIAEYRIPGSARIGDELAVSQPAFSPDIFYARAKDSTNSFTGQLPVDRDTLLGIDFADRALLHSNGNLFREISPNESLLRRTTRLARLEFALPPLAFGEGTAFFTFAFNRDFYYRYDLKTNDSFTSMEKLPVSPIALGKDVTVAAYPYGKQPLILLQGPTSTQFVLPNENGVEITVESTLPPKSVAIPSTDPDLFWFFAPREANLYKVRVSTGTAVPVESFRLATASILTGTTPAPAGIYRDDFAGRLYFTYPGAVIKIQFSGPLDNPQFVGAEKKTLKTKFTSLVPSNDFKKWFGLSSTNLDVLDEAFESKDTFPVNDVFGKRNGPVFSSVAAGLDADTVFVTSIYGQIARIELSVKKISSVGFDREPMSNILNSLTVDTYGRLHYSTNRDWFVLPLDLAENQAHLCRYLSGLGSRMYPDLKAAFAQTACAK